MSLVACSWRFILRRMEPKLDYFFLKQPVRFAKGQTSLGKVSFILKRMERFTKIWTTLYKLRKHSIAFSLVLFILRRMERFIKIWPFIFEPSCTSYEKTKVDFVAFLFINFKKNLRKKRNVLPKFDNLFLNHPVQVTKELDRFLTCFIHFEKNWMLYQNWTILYKLRKDRSKFLLLFYSHLKNNKKLYQHLKQSVQLIKGHKQICCFFICWFSPLRRIRNISSKFEASYFWSTLYNL